MTQDSPFDGLKIEDWPGGIESHHFATKRDSQRHQVNSGCGFGWRWVAEEHNAKNAQSGLEPSVLAKEAAVQGN